MIDVAAKRSSLTGAPASAIARRKVKFLIGDAQNLPFANDSFDIVTVGYGLRNLPSWEAGLLEIQRVLKPGGRTIILEFGKPDNSVWRNLYYAYLKLFVPVLGWVFCRDRHAYAYILESLKYYPGQTLVAAQMKKSGWDNVKVQNFLGGVMSINYGEKRS
jgi:demethylmenaquinone methyltransferase/2-methoxy-6-polyprenyl-1,4-benzoquinol methylase